MKNALSTIIIQLLAVLALLMIAPLSHGKDSISVESGSTEGELIENKQAENAAKNFITKMAYIKNMDAKFRQWILDERGDQIQEVEGRIQVFKPKKFSWETLEPFPQHIVTNGTLLWIYDKDLEQVTEQKLDNRIGHTPALLISGSLDQINQEFNVQQERLSSTDQRFLLLPHTDDHPFVRLSLVIRGNLISEMHLEDALGQKTLIEFYDMTINEPLDVALFNFMPPEGVDLIRDY